MALGGPGALGWMMLAAVVGLALKFSESFLSVQYRMQRKDGTYCGGPMVTLTRAFPGSGWRRCWLCFCRKHRAGISRNGQYDAGKLDCAGDAGYVWRGKRKSALVLTILLLLVVTGGLRSIAKAAEVLVPGMALFIWAGQEW